MHQQIVTITRQGQLTIPQAVRRLFGIKGSTKAMLKIRRNTITVEPARNFWSLAGALKSDVRLTDGELKKAKKSFAKTWARSV